MSDLSATVPVGILKRLVELVRPAMETKGTIPVYGAVRLDAKPGRLRATAQNIEGLCIEAWVAADFGARGSCCVAGTPFAGIVKRLPDGGLVELNAKGVKGGWILVKCGRGQYRISSFPVTDFPTPPTPGEAGQRFALPAADLLRIIAGTAFAQEASGARFFLQGVCLHALDGGPDGAIQIRAVATDGHRLARVQRPAPPEARGLPQLIVPRASVRELLRILEPLETAPVTVTASANAIRVEADGTALSSKLVDGTYPNYQSVIPSGGAAVVEVDAQALRDSVDRVLTVADEKVRTLDLTVAKGTIRIRAVGSGGANEATDEVDADYSGPPLRVVFSGPLLLDQLRQIVGRRVRLQPGKDGGPTLIHDDGEGAALYLLMPVQHK